MHQATGTLLEISLQNGLTGGRMLCPPNLIPAPGQYLLAHDPASDSPLTVPIFSADSTPNGFMLAPPIPVGWRPGFQFSLRGPLGHGFSLPVSARRVALVALEDNPYRLMSLLPPALSQGADVTFLSAVIPDNLPPDVEIQPLAALPEAAAWADFLALDVALESLPGVLEMLGAWEQVRALNGDAQALVVTPVPCGGMAKCGVCAVRVRHGWKMACKDGPVFDLKELRG